jgi:hypothetical protein
MRNMVNPMIEESLACVNINMLWIRFEMITGSPATYQNILITKKKKGLLPVIAFVMGVIAKIS